VAKVVLGQLIKVAQAAQVQTMLRQLIMAVVVVAQAQ
jgi:hypothetical protein